MSQLAITRSWLVSRNVSLGLLICGCLSLGCDKVETLVNDVGTDVGLQPAAPEVATPAPVTPQPAPQPAPVQPPVASAETVLAALKSRSAVTIDDQVLNAVASVPDAAAQVTELDLQSNQLVTGAGLAAIGKFTNLSKLLISGLIKVEPAEFNALGTLNALIELQASSTRIGNDSLPAIAGLTQLQKLSLSRTTVQGEAVGQLESLKNLQELELDGTGTDDAAAAKLHSLPLRKLNLNTTRLGNVGLAAIGKIDTLEFLHVGETGITGAGFAKLKLPNLRDLNVSRTAFGIDGMINVRRYTKLESLGVFQAGLALDNGTQWDKRADLKTLPQLTTLNIGSNELSDLGVGHLIAGSKSLQVLQMANLKGFSDRGLATLLKCKNLKYLDLTNTSVSGTGIQAMKQKMPELEILNGGTKY